MARTGRGRGRARAEVAVARVLEKRLGALPVVAEFGRRLRIAEIIDELAPVRPLARVTHGEVIEALVANRLTAPAPMLRVHEWAAAMAVEEAYGIQPELLNDDRIARALDAVAPQLEAIAGGVGAAAITEFGVDVSRLHWDLTSISLYGAYPAADAEYPAPRWGHPKDRRADLRQVQTGLAVSGDGGIPASPPPPAAATGCWKTAGWTCPARARPIRRCICAASWCTPPRTPPGRPKPAPANSPPPPKTSTGWCAPPGPGFTPPQTPSPPASKRSPQSAAPGPTCVPPSPTTPPASPSCRGTSTRPRSARRPRPTAGTPC